MWFLKKITQPYKKITGLPDLGENTICIAIFLNFGDTELDKGLAFQKLSIFPCFQNRIPLLENIS